MLKKLFLVFVLNIFLINLFSQQKQTQVASNVFYYHKINWWWNLSNSIKIDSIYVNNEIGKNNGTDTLFFNQFKFNIPQNSKILGIEVRLVTYTESTNEISNKVVCLTQNGSFSKNKANGTFWETGHIETIYGSKSDLWGCLLTPSIVNDSLFGFAIQVNPTPRYYRCACIDYVELSVYYDVASNLNIKSIDNTLLTPNPFKNEIVLLQENEEKINYITIHSSMGVELKSLRRPERINTSDLVSGIYFIIIHYLNGQVKIQKMIKE